MKKISSIFTGLRDPWETELEDLRVNTFKNNLEMILHGSHCILTRSEFIKEYRKIADQFNKKYGEFIKVYRLKYIEDPKKPAATKFPIVMNNIPREIIRILSSLYRSDDIGLRLSFSQGSQAQSNKIITARSTEDYDLADINIMTFHDYLNIFLKNIKMHPKKCEEKSVLRLASYQEQNIKVAAYIFSLYYKKLLEKIPPQTE